MSIKRICLSLPEWIVRDVVGKTNNVSGRIEDKSF